LLGAFRGTADGAGCDRADELTEVDLGTTPPTVEDVAQLGRLPALTRISVSGAGARFEHLQALLSLRTNRLELRASNEVSVYLAK
jgi:hypothetical protein